MAESRPSRKLIYFLGGLGGFLLGTAVVLYAVFTSDSSTASLGLMLIPLYGAGAALLACAVVYVAYTAADLRARRMSWRSVDVMVASALVTGALLFGAAVLLHRDTLAIASNPQSSPDELMAMSQRWLPLWREDVFIALVQNPSTPGTLLTALAEQRESNALVSLAAANPGTPLPALEAIAAGRRNYERDAGLAANPRITPVIAARLADVVLADFRDDLDYRLYQTFVLAALARNPATPQPVFDRLAAHDKPEYFLAVAVIYAERASCTQIAHAGKTGGDNQVLRNTAQAQMKSRGC